MCAVTALSVWASLVDRPRGVEVSGLQPEGDDLVEVLGHPPCGAGLARPDGQALDAAELGEDGLLRG